MPVINNKIVVHIGEHCKYRTVADALNGKINKDYKGIQMGNYLSSGDKAKHISTGATVQIIEILPKEFRSTRQAKCKCLKSTIQEDIGQIFEYELDSLEKLVQ